VDELQFRKTKLSELPSSVRTEFSKQDVLRRMEEDRERQKRLRERAWILPAKSFFDSMPANKPSTVVGATGSLNPNRTLSNINSKEKGATDALEVEFDFVWDNLSDLNEDDLEKFREDDMDWWGSRREVHQSRQAVVKVETQMEPSRKRKAEDVERYGQSEGYHRSQSYNPHHQSHRSNPQEQAPRITHPGPPPDPRMYSRPPRWSHQGGR